MEFSKKNTQKTQKTNPKNCCASEEIVGGRSIEARGE